MAVSRMRRIQLLAHRSAKRDVMAALREGGVLHIGEPSLDLGRGSDAAARRDRERELQARLTKLEYLRTYLKPHAPKRKNSLEAMFNPKLMFSEKELGEMLESFDVDSWYERVAGIEADIRSAETGITRKESMALELSHWAGLGMPVEDVRDTRLARVLPLTVESSELAGLADELGAEAPESDVVEVSRSSSSVFVVALFMSVDDGVVAPILKRHGARVVDLSGATGTSDAAAGNLLSEVDELRARIERLEGDATDAASDYGVVLAVLDETAEQLAKVAAEESFGSTKETFLIEGWIRARDEEQLRQKLIAVAPETHVVARDPKEGEEVPIDLRNNAAVTPFEFVTTLYGRPVYWEFDPTPLLAPFFILFFGLCVSDGGYGLILAALSFALMRKMQPGGGRKLMKLLFMGGVATALVGAVTGGWFGIDAGSLPSWLHAVRIRLRSGEYFNPLEHPMHMLDFVFVLGIAQIFTGLVVRMVADFRERRWADGILDQLVWIVFLTCLAPLGADFILGKDLPEEFMSFARTGAMVMVLVVVATGARKNKNPVMKVLGGVLKLYDVVGYFGDVLSYARLLALGLATGAIAMAINGVAEMAGGIPAVGIVAAIVVLIGGHAFNLAVNCLGGFVHSARLQYLEYFSKFFHGGGREFVPFRTDRKYSVIKE